MSDSPRDIGNTIQDALSGQLLQGSIDLVDIVPIPKHGDRMVRLRTIEEALEDFDRASANDGTIGYLIQVRPAKPKSQTNSEDPSHPGHDNTPKPSLDGTYLPNGKLNTPFLIKNAELLSAAGDHVLARNIYKAIMDSGEKTAPALLGLARCYEAEGKLKEAQAHYEESIAYHATPETYLNLANLFIRQKQDRQAADVYSRALNLKDLPTRSRFELHKACGNSWSRAGDAEKAVAQFQQALEITPSADDIRAALGCALLKAGKSEQAKACFYEAVAANPRNDQALYGLGSCALAMDDKRGAHDYFAKSLQVNLNNATAIFHLVKCAYEIKSYSTAASLLEQYMEVAPVNTNLLYSLAGLQFHLSRYNDSRATLDRIFQIAPNHAGARELSALIERYVGLPG